MKWNNFSFNGCCLAWGFLLYQIGGSFWKNYVVIMNLLCSLFPPFHFPFLLYYTQWLKTQHSKNEHHGIQSHHFMANGWETMETVTDFLFFASKITTDGHGSYEIERRLLLGRKAMKNLDRALKSRDVTLLTKIPLVKGKIFPVITCGCESWTIKKAECWRIDAFELWYWRLLRVPWTVRRLTNQS